VPIARVARLSLGATNGQLPRTGTAADETSTLLRKVSHFVTRLPGSANDYDGVKARATEAESSKRR